jgi:hypothetical protein
MLSMQKQPMRKRIVNMATSTHNHSGLPFKNIIQRPVFIQGRLNVTAHPAAARGLASSSLKIIIYKNHFFIVFSRFIILTKSVNSIVRLMFSFWIIIVYCIFVCCDATIQLLFPRLSLEILNHSYENVIPV